VVASREEVEEEMEACPPLSRAGVDANRQHRAAAAFPPVRVPLFPHEVQNRPLFGLTANNTHQISVTRDAVPPLGLLSHMRRCHQVTS
jgi:hypothetical protein